MSQALNTPKMPLKPLIFIFLISTLFSVTYGMFFYSSYRHLFDNQPLTVVDISLLLSKCMSISGIVGIISTIIGIKLINFKRLMLYSLILQTLGTYLLAFNKLEYINMGIAIYSVGYGITISALVMFIKYYLNDIKATQNQDKIIFTIDIILLNIGLLLGAIIGFYAIDFGMLYTYGYYFCGASVVTYILGQKHLSLRLSLEDRIWLRHIKFTAILCFALYLSYLSLNGGAGLILEALIILLTVCAFIYLFKVYIVSRKQGNEGAHKKVSTFFNYFFYIILFWFGYYAMYFIATNIIIFHSDLMFFDIKITSGSEWIGIVNTMSLAIVGGIITFYYHSKEPSYYKSFKVGLYFLALGFLILALVSSLSNVFTYKLSVITLFIMIISISESIMQPLSYTIVERLMPIEHQEVSLGIITFMIKSIMPTFTVNLVTTFIIGGDGFAQMQIFKITFWTITAIFIAAILSLIFITNKKCLKV